MSNDILVKLKQKINKNFASKFSLKNLLEYRFVPLNKIDGFFYIVISDEFKKETAIPYIESRTGCQIKVINVEPAEYKELFKFYQKTYCESSLTVSKTLHDEDDSRIKNAKTETVFEEKPKKRLGEILIEKKLITEAQLQEALTAGKLENAPIGSSLVKLGFISMEDLKDVLSEQQETEVLGSNSLKLDVKLLHSLPEDFIKENLVLPISDDEQTLIVGMVHPNNERVKRDIVYLTGKKVRAMLITHMEFESCVSAYYSEAAKQTNKIIRKLEKETAGLEIEESLFEQVERELQDQSGLVAQFSNKIITDAIDSKASDIHIEPRLTGYVVRYRTDGILRQVHELPPKVETSVITRFKVLARMNIAEHRRAQDGTFTLKYGGKDYDFRINTLPVGAKEKMVIRILAPAVSLNASDKEIKLIGGTLEDIEKIKKMIISPNGIILTTGPTGSGKTTTLYSVLKAVNDENINITTIEDPVEIKIDGINQSQINPKAGITFATCMRAILRQDPDVILIGEIRDFETLETAISAALTGHLVLSTLHTNSAAATVSRLIEMGAKSYLVASTITGIIAQRLVRRLCPSCKEKYTPTLEDVNQILTGEREKHQLLKVPLYKPTGCLKCNFDGYKGRLGVYEIMVVNKELKKLIAENVHDLKIEEAAISMGMKTLHQSCLAHIMRGETSIQEFIRVLGPVTE